MKAYDLGFGADPDSLVDMPGSAYPVRGLGAVRAGWSSASGPAIEREQWPRSPTTGLPMRHELTLLRPEEFRRRGPDLPAIAFFGADWGESMWGMKPPIADAASDDPFLRDLATHRPHPHATVFADLSGGHFALIWLTARVFERGPTEPPPDVRRPGEHQYDKEFDGWICAFEPHEPRDTAWLIERPDPNAGLTPTEQEDGSYQQPYDAESQQYRLWAAELAGTSHLGGTAFHAQDLPEWLTPWYLELNEIGRLNFGTGNGLLDLEANRFDWAC